MLFAYLIFGALALVAFDIASLRFLSGVLTLIVELFTLADAELQFDVFAGKIEREGNKRIALLTDERMELQDFLLMHEQLAFTERVAVEDISLFIGADVDSRREDLGVFNITVGILQIHASLTQALDLGAEERDTRLVSILHEEIVAGFSIDGDDFLPLVSAIKPFFLSDTLPSFFVHISITQIFDNVNIFIQLFMNT